MGDRATEIAAAEAARLEAAGLKTCLNMDCLEDIDQDATRCPWCRRRQGRVASGSLSGSRRRAPIMITFTKETSE